VTQPGQASEYRTAILATPGLASYWRLGPDTTAVAADELGSNNGTYAGGLLHGVAGPLVDDDSSLGALFGGVSGQITVNPLTASGGYPITLESWVRLTGTNKGTWIKNGSTSNGVGLGMGNGAFDAAGTQMLGLFEGVGYVVGPSLAGLSGWHHMAMTVDATGRRVKFYVDGVYGNTAYPTAAPVAATTIGYIGGYQNGGSARFYNGNMAEAAVYDTELDLQRIAQHYRLGMGQEQRAVPEIRFTPRTPPAKAVYTNPVNNPGARVDSSDWSSVGSDASPAVVQTNGDSFGAASGAIQATNTLVAAGQTRLNAILTPSDGLVVSPGDLVFCRTAVKAVSLSAGTLSGIDVNTRWWTSAGAFISDSVVTVNPAVGSWVEATSTATAPANAAFSTIMAKFRNSAAATGVFRATQAMLAKVKAGDTPGYFDGDTPHAVWTGTPNNSSSQLMSVISPGSTVIHPDVPQGMLNIGPSGPAISLGQIIADGGIVTGDPAIQGELRSLGYFNEAAS
jgi:hypothetical protein